MDKAQQPTRNHTASQVSGIYYHYSPDFNRGPLPGISRTISADGGHPAAILIEY